MTGYDRIPAGAPPAVRDMRRRSVILFVYHMLFLLAVYVVQSLILPYVTVLPSVPLILPLAAVGAAMFEGGARGAAMGLFAGALCDISMNQPVALFALLFTLMCLVIGVLSDAVLAPGFLSYLVLCTLALALCSFVQMFALLFFDGVPARYLLMEAGRQTVLSIPFALPVYFASRALVARE